MKSKIKSTKKAPQSLEDQIRALPNNSEGQTKVLYNEEGIVISGIGVVGVQNASGVAIKITNDKRGLVIAFGDSDVVAVFSNDKGISVDIDKTIAFVPSYAKKVARIRGAG